MSNSQMEDEFNEIVKAYKTSEDVRPKSKRELLEPLLAEKREARAQRRREFKCFYTPPFGHYYQKRQCVACEKIEGYEASNGAEIATAILCLAILVFGFLYFFL